MSNMDPNSTDSLSQTKQKVLEEIANRDLKKKRYHSETSLQQYGEGEDDGVFDDKDGRDPGVQNAYLGDLTNTEDLPVRRRTMSQPGPISGSMLTATAARAARKRPQKNVMYASDLDRSDSGNDRPSVRLPRGDDSGTATPIFDRNNAYNTMNGNYRNADAKSLNSYRLYIPYNDGRGAATPRKRSVATMDAQSIRSVETQAPPPTTPEDRRKHTLKFGSIVMSSIYAVLLVSLGIMIYVGDSFVGDISISHIYSLILCAIGFVYIIFLIFDINKYKSIALKNQRIKGLHEEKISEFFRKQEEDYLANNGTPISQSSDMYRPPSVPPPVLIPLKHEYCFSHGRHSGSFYLKLGAAGFAIGHLVHSVLLIAVQVGFLVDGDVSNEECLDILQIVLDVMFPCYCFLQLYFIFKYSNVIILRFKPLACFAFMHMIGSSLCFWVSAIVRETTLALRIYANSVYGNGEYGSNASRKLEIDDYTAKKLKSRFFDISGLYNEKCIGSKAVNNIVEHFSPYLYPFSVEFNILIVAVYYIIWSNIGNCHAESSGSDDTSTFDDKSICQIPTANEDNDFTSNIVIHADCHASNRGLFAGIMLIVVVIGMLIIGFVFSSAGENFLELGYLLNDCLKLGLHSVMLIGAVIAFNQIRKLDVNEHPISVLDDVLLFICLPAFFLETVLSMIATINILNIVKSVDLIVMVVQVIIQTPLIMDGLRRCSNSKKLRRSKPGRELLMFLLIANVGTWLFNTFSYKSPDSLDERYEYYGKVLWTVLGHISLPLIMFFRFHSSVCFADIWDSAYKPGSEH